MDANLRVILQQLEAEKSIDRQTLIEAIRSALESAARKGSHHAANVTVEVEPSTLTFRVFEILTVVEQVTDHTREMSPEEARRLNANAKVGDRLKIPTEPRDFGRIAAQTAKQVIIQKIKDAERERVFDEFKKREGELVTGVVKRLSHGNVIVAVDRAEAILPQREQSPRETFKPGDRIRAYLIQVDKSARGPQIVLSRTTPELVRTLFELEVPEIYDGTIRVMGIAREAGSRTKIAVMSTDSNVDPVGACVGMKGSRVRAVVEELCGEKIDIVRWSQDPVELCGYALNPADILDITVDEESKGLFVVVPHDQLSLAIGKRGQNARLASRLMGWNIDIKSDVELAGTVAPAAGQAAAADEAAQSGTETPATAESQGADEPAASSEAAIEAEAAVAAAIEPIEADQEISTEAEEGTSVEKQESGDAL